MISLIAAIGKNNELGKGNELLWHMPADMKHFKETTSGHSVIMGRKTYESIGRALPNRQNIVVTRNKDFSVEGVEIVNSIPEAIELTKDKSEVFIIGGAEIYSQAMPHVNKLYITHIDAIDLQADTFFPEIDKNSWKESNREDHIKDTKNPYNYSFVVYEKNKTDDRLHL